MKSFSTGAAILACALASPHDPGAQMDASRFVSVTAGADHACALTDGGEAYCWGSNEFGQLGTGTADAIAHTRPARVSADVKFQALVAGFTHTCGLTGDGVAYCWGANDSGQLGDGTVKNSAVPVRVSTEIKFLAIGPGGTHTCGTSLDSVGYCWGGNWHGQLGVGDREGDVAAPCCRRMPTPVRTALRLRSVVAGGISSCGVALDGAAYCWGSPQEGRLGTGEQDAINKSADKTIPAAVTSDTKFIAVMPRAWHTCGLSDGGAVFCWGGNIFQMESAVPKRVGPNADFVAVSTGQLHDCAVSRDGGAYCWGQNADGEIGDGTIRDAATPQKVATNRRLAAIAAGGNLVVGTAGAITTWGFTCGLTTDGAILCWGDNRHGALGNGSTLNARAPTLVSRR